MRVEHRSLALALALAATTLAACGHEVTSPDLTAQTVQPDLVCVEQLTTRVILSGDGFTPMPIDTMKDQTHLVLPQVVLARTQDLTGASASGEVVLPDDPADVAASLVQWQSERQMSFDVTPDLALDPGLYDVRVTNPDEKHRVVFAGGLAAVPRPTLSAVSEDLVCDAQEVRTLTLTGTGILQVGSTMPVVHVGGDAAPAAKDYTATAVGGCTPVPGTHAEGEVSSCTTATFQIPEDDLPPGIYEVSLTNPAPANCVSTDVLTVTIVPPPTITAIAPDLICSAQEDQTLTITGTGFLTWGTTAPTVAIGDSTYTPTAVEGCEALPGPVTEGPVQTCTSITFVVPAADLPAGDYAVTVENPPPAGCHSVETINLHVAPPPTLTAIVPAAICDAQGDQTITLSGTGFLTVGGTAPTVTIGGTPFVPTADGCTAVPGTFAEGTVQECTTLVVVVPEGTFTGGEYPVTVTNPPPADCHTTEALTLVLHDPPIVTSTVPATVCAGGGDLLINGSRFQPGASVSLEASGEPTVSSSATTVNSAGTQIDATFPGPLQPGNVYDVVVNNNDGCTDALPHSKVTVVSGPIAFFADPEVVYNGINTRVTVYATTLQLPLPADAVTIVPAGQSSPVTTLTWAAVPNHPNRVQVVVPQGQTPGPYDLVMNDATGCSTILPQAITVTDALSITLKAVAPPFGYDKTETDVTIKRDTAAPAPADAPFVATPRVFLNPANPQPTDIAIQVKSVSFVDADTLTAVVPKDQPAHVYDLIVVNPNGTVGYLPDAFTVMSVPPPVVTTVTPSSIVAASGQAVTISGLNFNASTVALTCVDALGQPEGTPPVSASPPSCTGADCTQAATIDASGLAAGSVCVLRLTNADGSYFDYSAIGVTNSSLNLSNPHGGTAMNVGRRALVASAGNATAAARFVYAIGGDGGSALAATPFDSVERASVDLYGTMGPWQLLPTSTLGTPRSFAGAVTVGRYVYVFGGSDGTSELQSAERARILDPAEVPLLDIDDLVPAATGLDAGYWFYRVAAVFSASDPDNPGGESLPSDEFIVKVPNFPGKKIQVVLAWTAPVDPLGVDLPNVTGYRIYRSPSINGASGDEVLLATVGASVLKFTDDGTATPGTAKPLTLGALGRWAPLPALGTPRMGPAGAFAFDPATPGTFYVYALMGRTAPGAVTGTYEYLPVTVLPNGHHAVAAEQWTPGVSSSTTGRWQLGAWSVDRTVQSNYGASTWIFIGGGLSATGTLAGTVEAGLVAAGGDLGTLDDTPKDFTSGAAGYGVCGANRQLFLFGGANATPSSGARSAALFDNGGPLPPPTIASNAWNAEGLAMQYPRYLMGSAVQSAFIFLVGGQIDISPASTTTELVIW